MNGVPLAVYLGISLFMFFTGAVGVVVRRNPVVVFMCVELMLNAVNLTFVAFARYAPSPAIVPGQESSTWMAGQMAVIFVMAIAAAEVAVGLGIIMAIYRLRNKVDLDEMSTLRG
ncbi:MAG: NADH-quinone oxidoreductase subunit NuoK [Armatimonadetes bacterium]|nr:NADH-quinone oxidoreductase subunit NuoK [Armatimonadota bacterium]